MGKKIFDSDDSTSEYELLDSTLPTEAEQDDAVNGILAEYEDEEQEEVVQPTKKVAKGAAPATAYRLNSQETDIMGQAVIQLEQAKLYDMFLKHNLFDGIKANPTALKRVETELKGFILERMQILLGLKQPKAAVQQIQQVKVESQFNEVEADFLRALAFKGTKGESANAPVKSEIKSLRSIVEAPQTGLKRITQQYQEPEDQGEVEEETEEEVAPLRRPVARVVPNPTAKPTQTAIRKQAKPSTIEEIAREDIRRMAKRKPAHEMTDSELMAQNKKINSNKGSRPSNALPMPGPDQMTSHYMTQQVLNSGNSGNNQLLNILSNKMGFSTNSVQQMGDDD